MTTSPNISDCNSSQSPVLVGVIVDVSSSMRRNWHNRNGRQLPRIEIIRDTINRWIMEERRLSEAQADNIKMFCLGMGFKAPMHWTDVDCSDAQEHSLGNAAQKRIAVHLICDLLALSEILPSKEKLIEFKEKLNQKWVEYTKDILEKSVITENRYVEIVEYVQVALYKSALQRFHSRLYYKLFNRFDMFLRRFRRFYHFLQGSIRNKEEKIELVSKTKSIEYADNLFINTTQEFTKNHSKYIAIIYKRLNLFAQLYIQDVLQALTLGFEIHELVEDLNKEKAISIAEQIYQDLEREVIKHIILILKFHQRRLYRAGRSISASLNKKELQYRTKSFIQKNGWDILKPLIQETVTTMFEKQFEKQSIESFPYWIRLATTREMVRPISQLSNMLPDILEEHVYSDEVMFGTTPFKEALDKAAIRLIDKVYQDYKKVLIVISDGEFQEESTIMVSANLLKRRGVIIISCLVSDKNIFARLVNKSVENWSMGAQLMVDLASKASELDSTKLLRTIKKSEKSLPDKKLCIQINHSRILKNVLEGVFESYRNPEKERVEQ